MSLRGMSGGLIVVLEDTLTLRRQIWQVRPTEFMESPLPSKSSRQAASLPRISHGTGKLLKEDVSVYTVTDFAQRMQGYIHCHHVSP